MTGSLQFSLLDRIFLNLKKIILDGWKLNFKTADIFLVDILEVEGAGPLFHVLAANCDAHLVTY